MNITSKHNDEPTIIALDAMGGDNAPLEVIMGAEDYLQNDSNTLFKIYGNKDKVLPIIEKTTLLKKNHLFFLSKNDVSAEEKPSHALRHCKESSMFQAISALKQKEVDAVVSAGNTGALMAMSTITLRTIAHIQRPAIVAILPTTKGKTVVLDLGANVDCSASNLYQFAIMGHVFAKINLGIEKPRIGLLNMGSEETKGRDSIKLTHHMLSETEIPINYCGYIEGNNISDGSVDVVVTDGFTGNVLLKMLSGNAKLYSYFLKKSFSYNLFSKIKYFLVRDVFKRLAKSLDNRYYNGAMFIGVNGIVVKSHGSMDRIGISNAIKVAVAMARGKINDCISSELAKTQPMEEM